MLINAVSVSSALLLLMDPANPVHRIATSAELVDLESVIPEDVIADINTRELLALAKHVTSSS